MEGRKMRKRHHHSFIYIFPRTRYKIYKSDQIHHINTAQIYPNPVASFQPFSLYPRIFAPRIQRPILNQISLLFYLVAPAFRLGYSVKSKMAVAKIKTIG